MKYLPNLFFEEKKITLETIEIMNIRSVSAKIKNIYSQFVIKFRALVKNSVRSAYSLLHKW